MLKLITAAILAVAAYYFTKDALGWEASAPYLAGIFAGLVGLAVGPKK